MMPETPEFFDPYDSMGDVDYMTAPNPLEMIYGDDMPKPFSPMMGGMMPGMMMPGMMMPPPVPILVAGAGGKPPVPMMMPPGGGPLVPYAMP